MGVEFLEHALRALDDPSCQRHERVPGLTNTADEVQPRHTGEGPHVQIEAVTPPKAKSLKEPRATMQGS